MQYKTSTTPTKFPEKMAAITPVAIGTRGTVGSLVRKEIEFFSKFELASQKPQAQVVGMAPTSGHSRPSFWFLIMTWKKKKQRGSSRFLPSVCSAVEVAESNQLNRIPGFNYRILKNDLKNLHI